MSTAEPAPDTSDGLTREEEELLVRLEREEARRLDAEIYLRQLVLARRGGLLDFICLTHPDYQPGWFHRELCQKLEKFSLDVFLGRSPRLILSAPPRHGKTEIISKQWPVWHMAQYGHHEIVAASYASDLANDNSRAARETARSPEVDAVYPGLRPTKNMARYKGDYRRNDVDRLDNWKMANKARYKSVGVGKGLTGHGAHILIIDDPVKDAAEANSPVKRDRVWQWYLSTARTRLAPGAGIVIMCTRWHQDDLIGRVLAQAKNPGAHQWEVINYEAIATEDEKHRKRGEALHPERWPLKELLALKADLTPYWWAALFQGSPVAAEGNQIKKVWFKERYKTTPQAIAAAADEVWITSDAAKKGKHTSDFHAIHVWARKGPRYYLLDRRTERMGMPEYEAAMDAMHAKWDWARTGTLVEDQANGTTYLQYKEGQIRGLHDFQPTRDTPGKDKSKAARATYLERAAEAGQIILPDVSIAPWVEEWLLQVCNFPVAPNDDDVDASSQLIMRWELAAMAGRGSVGLADYAAWLMAPNRPAEVQLPAQAPSVSERDGPESAMDEGESPPGEPGTNPDFWSF